ncbi:TPA: hypothetical protein ACX6R6_002238 [Photobacterium damselae]
MAKPPKKNNSETEIADGDQVTGSLIYRRVPPEKKKELKKLIKEVAKKHGLVSHIFERK